jgi:uridine kinase
MAVMQGDVIIVEEQHRRVAETIAERLLDRIRGANRIYTVTVAGESGSGKSETATAIKEALKVRGLRAEILQQDDYFVFPPKTNDGRRRADIGWVGPGEVRLDLLDEHLASARAGAAAISKPLVVYDEDRITEEELSLAGVDVVIAEGTYTTSLEQVDTRVFIQRDYKDTLQARQRRGREEFDPYIEEVLEIEHGIISRQSKTADVLISRDFEVAFT